MKARVWTVILLAVLLPAVGFAGTADNSSRDQATLGDQLLGALDTIVNDWFGLDIDIVDDDVIEGELPSLGWGPGPSDSPYEAERADIGWDFVDD
jgi:hypothetical protein